MTSKLEVFLLVLIVAKCNVNTKEFAQEFASTRVLIVAKCNVNDQALSIKKSEP